MPTKTRSQFMIVHEVSVTPIKYRNSELPKITVQPPHDPTLAGDSKLSRQLFKTPNLTVFWLVFRVNSPPLDNVRLRLAMAQAIDRDAYVSQVLAGQGLPATTFIPKGMHGYSPNLTSQKFDVAQARASLAASGLSAKQVSVTFSYDQSSDFRTKTAKFVHDQLVKNLGINVILHALDTNTPRAHKDT